MTDTATARPATGQPPPVQLGEGELITLTDAELAVLAPGSTIAPTPWLKGVFDRPTALKDARSGLVARGVAREDAYQPGRLRIHPTVAALLAARRSPEAVLVAQQQTRTESLFLVLHLQAADRCLVESVSGHGLHRFAATSSTQAVSEAATWAAGEARGAALADAMQTRESLLDLSLAEFSRRATELVGDAERVTVLDAVSGTGAGRRERRITTYASGRDLRVALPLPGGGLRLVRSDLTFLASLLASMFVDRTR